MNRTVAMHIAHRLDVFLLTVVELFLQGVQLLIELNDIPFQLMDIAANGVDGLTLVGNFGIQHHQILQTPFHIPLVRTQTTLLLTDVLLNLLTLVLQTFDRGGRHRCGALLGCPLGRPRGGGLLGRCTPLLRLHTP